MPKSELSMSHFSFYLFRHAPSDGRVFVSILGQKGVPATLGTVSDTRGPSGPLIRPYPDWSWFGRDDCDAITSVYRIAVWYLAFLPSKLLTTRK